MSIRRFFINNNAVDDPANWEEFNFSNGRDAKYKGLFKKFPDVRLKWYGSGKEALQADYNKYKSTWRNTLILVEQSTDNGNTWTTELNSTIDFEKYNEDFDGEGQFVEVSIRQNDLLSKFQSRDEVSVDIQSLVDFEGNLLQPNPNETFDVDLDTQIIRKYLSVDYVGLLSDSTSFASFSNSDQDSVAYNLPFDNRVQDQIEYSYLYPPNNYVWQFGPQAEDNLQAPILNNAFFENQFFNIKDEQYTEVNVTITGNVLATISVPANWGTPVWELVIVGRKFANEEESEGSAIANVQLTAAQDIIFPENYGVILDQTISLNLGVVGPLDQFDRVYAYIYVTGINGANGLSLSHRFITPPTLEFEYITGFPTTNCRVVLIHDFLKRILQNITGIQEPLRSDFYGSPNSTYPTDSGTETYVEDGDGAIRGVTNIFQVRQFSIEDEPMVSSFSNFFNWIWSQDACAIGMEFLTDGTPYFRIEPIEYFYDKTNTIIEFTSDGVRPKRMPLSIDQTQSYNKIRVGDKNYKDEEFGLLDTINALREFSIFTESSSTKTYDIVTEQITSGTVIELARRNPFNDFELEDTTYDDEIVIIDLIRTGATSFNRAKDEDFSSVTGIVDGDTYYNLKLTPKRRLLNHLKVLASALVGVIENAADYGNPEIEFKEGKGNFGYSTQLTTEATPVVESANIPINSANIEPLYTNETTSVVVPADLAQRNILLGTNNGHIVITSRGVTRVIFADQISIIDQASGRVEINGRIQYDA